MLVRVTAGTLLKSDDVYPRTPQDSGERVRQRLRTPAGRGQLRGAVVGVGLRDARCEEDREQGTLIRVQLRPREVAKLLDQAAGGISVHLDMSIVAQ